MQLAAALKTLEQVAPSGGAEPWDQVGLQVGDPRQAVDVALLCIDYTPAVLEEAARLGARLVVAYHPPMFKPLGRLTTGDGGGWKQTLLVETVRAGVAVYSPHTALDAAEGGTNDALCDAIAGDGASDRRAIRPIVPATEVTPFSKIVVFTPKKAAAAVRAAMAAAGAGGIGQYRGCAFEAEGTGRFEPMAGASPTVGAVGHDEAVAELRLEMRAPTDRIPEVLDAARSAHPYEEPAIDVFPLTHQPPEPIVAGSKRVEPGSASIGGAGRVLTLAEPINRRTLVQRVQKFCGVERVERVVGPDREELRSIAVCVGAGGSLFEGLSADAFVTGEMRHHDQLDHTQAGSVVVLPGHTETERPYLPHYAAKLNALADGVEWRVTAIDRLSEA